MIVEDRGATSENRNRDGTDETGTMKVSGEGNTNSSDLRPIEILPNSVILNHDDSRSYKTIKRLCPASVSGESDVYLCSSQKKQFVLKIYRRKMDIDPEKNGLLMTISGENIAQIIDYGKFCGRSYEIYDYYSSGSLKDELDKRSFSYEELKRTIIPGMNEGLHVLHNAKLLHRDIKPSNILWKDANKNSIVLIDFGLSSIAYNESLSVLVSQVGGTLMYSDPKVFQSNRYIPEYDYYSMGIVLYELFCGRHPFLNDQDAADAPYIPQPKGMPNDLYALIQGLTYPDLRFRHDLNNPNRRWTYNEVKKWLNGEAVPVPGTTRIMGEREIAPVKFEGEDYTSIDDLCYAMAANWKSGREFLMGNNMVERLKVRAEEMSVNQRLWISEIEDTLKKDVNIYLPSGYYGLNRELREEYTGDIKLVRILDNICPDRGYIACPMGFFKSLNDLGEKILILLGLDKNEEETLRDIFTCIELLFKTNTLLEFSKRNPRAGSSEYDIEKIKAFTDLLGTSRWETQMHSIAYDIAFFLSQKQTLDLNLPDHKTFNSIDELQAYIVKKSNDDLKSLYWICSYFLDGAHQLKPKLYGWMHNRGCRLDGFNQ